MSRISNRIVSFASLSLSFLCASALTVFLSASEASAQSSFPNLTASSPSLSCTRLPNGDCQAGSMTISGSVSNSGGQPATVSFSNGYQYSSNGNNFYNFGNSTSISGLAPGAGRSLSSYTWSGGTGVWYFKTCADTSNSVSPEQSESDNCSSSTRVVISSAPPPPPPPPPSPTPPPPPSSPAPSQSPPSITGFSASSNPVISGASFTLTANANKTQSPYSLNIYRGGSQIRSCGSATYCSVSQTISSDTSFAARIEYSSNIVSSSNITVRAETPSAPAYSIWSFSVCDASTGGTCGSTLYAGTGYYKSSVINTGNASGNFSGEFQYRLGGGSWQSWPAVSETIPAGAVKSFQFSNPTGVTSAYSFRFCQSGTSNCSGSANPKFISAPSLSASASSVLSGGSVIFTISSDPSVPPSYGNYLCGGGALASSGGGKFTCQYINTGSQPELYQASVRVSQGSASQTASSFITINPSPRPPTTPTISASTGSSCGGLINLSYGGGGGATSFRLHRNPDRNGVRQFGEIVSVSARTGLPASESSLSPGASYQYQLEAVNNAGSTWSGLVSATPSESCFDYTLVAGPLSITRGGTAELAVSAQLSGVSSRPVLLSVSGVPSGGSAAFSKNPLTPSDATKLTVHVPSFVRTGSYSFTINGSPLGRSVSVPLTITEPTLSLSLFASPRGVQSFEATTITATIGGTAAGVPVYSNHSCGGGVVSNITGNTFTCTYGGAGRYTASVTANLQGLSATTDTGVEVSALLPATVELVANGSLQGRGGVLRVPYGGYATLSWTSLLTGRCTGTGFSTNNSIENRQGVIAGPVFQIQRYSIICSNIRVPSVYTFPISLP